ncbi:MAG: hypothetical protein IH846_13885 [Acidobacteria bacterium]|nr:hypothetical protein [Acidobacteriota bacterium]
MPVLPAKPALPLALPRPNSNFSVQRQAPISLGSLPWHSPVVSSASSAKEMRAGKKVSTKIGTIEPLTTPDGSGTLTGKGNFKVEGIGLFLDRSCEQAFHCGRTVIVGDLEKDGEKNMFPKMFFGFNITRVRIKTIA